MQPVKAAEGWPIPQIETAGALADWLQLDLASLEWFADLQCLNRKANPLLRHYHYRVLTKQSGTIRLIEAPKPRLKAVQRKILVEILERSPPHPCVHGFLKGHSIKTFVTPHVGQRVILKMDLEDFFPSISRARVQALFRTMGYPESVADLLGGICTSAAPYDIWKLRDLYTQPASPTRRADFSRASQPLRLSRRLPPVRSGKIRRGPLPTSATLTTWPSRDPNPSNARWTGSRYT